MLSFGDIVLVPFPFTDLTSMKVRPALVVSRGVSTYGDVILCFLSSRIDPKDKSLIILEPDKGNGLKVPSAIRFDKIATLSAGIVLGVLGRVSQEWLRHQRKRFLSGFGF